MFLTKVWPKHILSQSLKQYRKSCLFFCFSKICTMLVFTYKFGELVNQYQFRYFDRFIPFCLKTKRYMNNVFTNYLLSHIFKSFSNFSTINRSQHRMRTQNHTNLSICGLFWSPSLDIITCFCVWVLTSTTPVACARCASSASLLQ